MLGVAMHASDAVALTVVAGGNNVMNGAEYWEGVLRCSTNESAGEFVDEVDGMRKTSGCGFWERVDIKA